MKPLGTGGRLTPMALGASNQNHWVLAQGDACAWHLPEPIGGCATICVPVTILTGYYYHCISLEYPIP